MDLVSLLEADFLDYSYSKGTYRFSIHGAITDE